MKVMLIFFFSICCCLRVWSTEAQSDAPFPIRLDADEVDYNGKAIQLIGHVTVEHELGRIRAGKVYLQSADPKSMQFVTLQMEEDVIIDLPSGGELRCAKADVDYKKLMGVFIGENGQGVTYVDHFGKQNETPLTIAVNSKTMEAFFDQEEGEDKKKKQPHLKRIIAENDVNVDYNQELQAKADYATYVRYGRSSDELMASFPGLISLHGTNGLCHVQSVGGDSIDAKDIQIDTTKRLLTLAQPKGQMQTMAKQIDFKADELLWDEKEDSLLLAGE